MIRSFVSLAVVTAMMGLAAGCGSSDPAIAVSGATIPVPMNPTVAALYFVINNSGGADVLTQVATDTGATATLHRSSMNPDGTSAMETLHEVPIDEGSSLAFKPGGYHVMLDNPGDLAVGQQVEVTLRFKTSDPIIVSAEVVESLTEESHGH